MINVEVFETPQSAAKSLAKEVAALIRSRAAEGKNVILGLATGATPLPFYAELVRLHKEEGLSFSNVISFNLDEYSGLNREHPESYWYFMHHNLFDHIDIKPENVNLPSGLVKGDEIPAHCAAYEKKIKDLGGIDLQILGIGRTGHIGFNEPGSDDKTITRQVHLDELTRSDAAPSFNGIANVPTTAITMGVATIMGARKVALMAWGEKKASIVKKAVQGSVTPDVAASYLQNHNNAVFLLDKAAATDL
ncbi:MAG: glucosamine-6-phosphate deaminase [Akkermansia sp.]